VSGTVTAGNDALAEQPELLNHEPYGAGWLFRVEPASATVAAALLSAADYATYLADEAK
jgi:glycine cleavage system H protein